MAAASIPDAGLRGAASLITARQTELARLCREFHIRRLELFGSALMGAFDPEHSDLDFLVEFSPLDPSEYAAAYFGFKEAVEKLFGRPADLVIPSAIRNPYFREAIQNTKALLYAA
ncbi:MAG TPA: nucleotidyltransferase domain-containing protein [Terracidiphilus sp.]|nr:nucleotidyltransferase domain-containing protein [Terracidiphilus sp.]